MLGNKYILIGAGVFLLIVGVIAVYMTTRKPAAPNQIQQPPVVSNGGVNGQPQLTTSTQRCGAKGYCVPPKVFIDPAQPFAVNAPRTTEPEKNNTAVPPSNSITGTNSASNSSSNAASQNDPQHQLLVADGIIPTSNGDYVQTVDPSGWNKAMVSQYDYNLTDNQFLQAYYPDYQQVLTHSTPGDLALQHADPILKTGNVPGTPAATNTAMQLVAGMDAKQFNVSSLSSTTDMQNYIQTLSDQTQAFDIVHDNTIMSGLLTDLSNLNFGKVSTQKSQTDAILNSLKNDSVPSAMLGLHESYYDLYTKYNTFLDDLSQIQGQTTKAQLQPILATIQSDAGAITTALGVVQTNIGIAGNILTPSS